MTRRLRLLLLFSLAALVVGVPGAVAGNFDEEKMGCVGENPAVCPPGTVGQPYSLTIYLAPPDGGRGEDFGCATFRSAGAFPPGLSISDEGYITGTPTQAGTYDFYLEVFYNKNPGCAKTPSDDRFIITINPGVPKLTIGPESAPVGTVGTPYSLQMTASVADPKVWSIAEGQLPAGLTLDPSSGLISGTPAADGSFSFLVSAAIADGRTDTKWLTVLVRPQLVLAAATPFAEAGRTRWEIGVPFLAKLAATGGTGAYTFALAGGALPLGLALSSDGVVQGTPKAVGPSRAVLSVTDDEGRAASYVALFLVAPRLSVARPPALRPAIVGRAYRARFRTTGGVGPVTWARAGRLPRGVRFDGSTGVLTGMPRAAGRFRIVVQATDQLGVKSKRSYLLVVKAPKKPKTR